jgi:long-chain acyl-CoA synthetase
MAFETLCAMFQASVTREGDRLALAGPGHPGYTWPEYADAVARLAPVFADLGVRPHQPVALATVANPDFHVVDTALLHAGAVPYSLPDRDTDDGLLLNLRRSGAEVVVTDGRHREQVRRVATAHGGLTAVVLLDGEPGPATDGGPPELTLAELLARPSATDFDTLWRAVGPEDVATLIFTSGTTGEPKIVQLSHRAFAVSERSTDALAPFGAGGDVLSYLPLNHTAERFMSHYAGIAYGPAIHSVPDPATLYDDIARIRPSRFFGIPRVYEKLADRAHVLVDADPALAAAVGTSLARVRAEQARTPLPPGQVAAADAALATLAPVRAALGLDRAEYLGVATAPSSVAMIEFFLALGLRVSDLWGMSEIIMCTLNPPDDIRLGTVGAFLNGVEGRIAADGEIQVRGPNAFSGYLGDPERTAATMADDGWISTGDLGSIDEGYLSIRGRKKDMLITSSGLNIAPAAIEAALKDASPLIEHAIAVADGRRHVTALLALDPDELTARTGREDADFAALVALEVVQEALARAVAAANATLEGPQTVRAWWVAGAPWRPGTDELTPTSKLRRDVIAAKYTTEIDQLYR